MSAINRGNIARFKDNERGSVMTLFGLMLPVMLFTAGVDIQVSRATGTVSIKVDSEVPMTLTAIAGFDKVNLPVNTETVFGSRDLEIGMALDITGSMGDTPSGGGQRKIDALKGAFELF